MRNVPKGLRQRLNAFMDVFLDGYQCTQMTLKTLLSCQLLSSSKMKMMLWFGGVPKRMVGLIYCFRNNLFMMMNDLIFWLALSFGSNQIHTMSKYNFALFTFDYCVLQKLLYNGKGSKVSNKYTQQISLGGTCSVFCSICPLTLPMLSPSLNFHWMKRTRVASN